MDNEGLLEWAEYEVEKAQAVLDRAITHVEQLEKVVTADEDREAFKADMLAMKSFVDTENRFKMVYGVSITEAKRRGAVITEAKKREADKKKAEDLEVKMREAEYLFWARWGFQRWY